MSLRLHALTVAAAVVLLDACGSSDTNSLWGGGVGGDGGRGTGSTADAAAGATAAAGGASTGGTAAGASTGAGGASGAASGGAGGSGTGSGGAGSGGTGPSDAGGASQGGASDSGAVPPDASSTLLVPGGIISSQCTACAQSSCDKEAAACQADPACVQIYSCVASCFIPLQCAACFLGSGSGPQKFSTLECCTSRQCGGLCPSVSAGVFGCP